MIVDKSCLVCCGLVDRKYGQMLKYPATGLGRGYRKTYIVCKIIGKEERKKERNEGKGERYI